MTGNTLEEFLKTLSMTDLLQYTGFVSPSYVPIIFKCFVNGPARSVKVVDIGPHPYSLHVMGSWAPQWCMYSWAYCSHCVIAVIRSGADETNIGVVPFSVGVISHGIS